MTSGLLFDENERMRAVLQRVSRARVKVGEALAGQIDSGWLVLIGCQKNDGENDLEFICNKIKNLRCFPDSKNKMNLSIKDIHGEILIISQFTLLGNCDKGRRPSFTEAEEPEKAKLIYEKVIDYLKGSNLKVESGVFGAAMQVELVNDGPVTMLLDSRKG
jgi:D-tyrosyl-tRNA(Tyr) deacylase